IPSYARIYSPYQRHPTEPQRRLARRRRQMVERIIGLLFAVDRAGTTENRHVGRLTHSIPKMMEIFRDAATHRFEVVRQHDITIVHLMSLQIAPHRIPPGTSGRSNGSGARGSGATITERCRKGSG